MPGQNLAAGEKPSWAGKRHRLHHALRFGDKLWAGCWHAGVRVIDVSDIRAPKTIGEYNYHPPFPEPSHTFMPVPFEIEGRRIALAIDEEDHAHDEREVERRRGRPHGCLWVLDVTDLAHIKPLSIYDSSGKRCRSALRCPTFTPHGPAPAAPLSARWCAWRRANRSPPGG